MWDDQAALRKSVLQRQQSENIADFREYAEKRKKREPDWLKPLYMQAI